MNRSLAVAIAAILLAALAIRSIQDDGGARGGCDGVREAAQVVNRVELGGAVPTSETYSTAAQELRRSAVAAPGGVAPDLHALADAYGQLGIVFQGFDPEDGATYSVIEQRAPDIEREEARVDEAARRVTAWLEETCTG